ncbi:MAG: outer membrane lipoprotein carrier protein LolA [Chitinophagaceae bacterium]|nr:outer membrane lipoprotein carrier protein LolA [Chitinophagaceae bacterium]
MKKILSILIFFAFIINASAQSNSLGKNDPEAKKILDAVSNKFKTYKSLKGNFILEIKDANGKIQGTKKGKLMMKGNKYAISLTGQEIMCDGKNVWTYDQAANEVQLDKFDPNGSTLSPQKLFTNFYDKDFLYMLRGLKKVGTKTLQEVELTPTDKTKSFFKVLVTVEKSENMITNTQIFEKNGNRFAYEMNNVVTNATLGDELFVFDLKKYKGIEVIDIR